MREAVQSPSVVPAVEMTRVETALDRQGDDSVRRQRMAELEAELAALRIERDRLAGQVDTHQIDGERRLAELKRQWKSTGGSERERFAEAARNEMESALMMDEEYRAQLQEADEKLQRTERELRELRKRVAAPQK